MVLHPPPNRVLGWVVALIGLTAIHSAAGSAYSDNFRLSGTQSFDAVNLLERSRPARPRVTPSRS